MEKYTIIENDIIECINSGKLKNGEKIPSESELCEKYKVSRTTVRKALANLSTSGKIIRKIGDGSYVNEQVFVNNTGRALSFRLSGTQFQDQHGSEQSRDSAEP